MFMFLFFVDSIMPRVGYADLPLHGGNAPRWLFIRMVDLAAAISDVVIDEYGTREYLRRISDPFWFQAFSCVLGFDWHSSGTTTVTCGALKEALKGHDFIFVTGGKGRASRHTLMEIAELSESAGISTRLEENLKRSSKLSAKVDNAALQDGYELYHHTFIFDADGNWATVQQGMSGNGYARRYHWFSGNISDLIEEPHSAIVGNKEARVLDLTSRNSRECRRTSVDLICDGVERLKREVVSIGKGQTTLYEWSGQKEIRLFMPRSINWNALTRAYEFSPRDYEELLLIRGIGPSTVRALALISELVYGKQASWKDPVKYSFAVGGKDGVPFPVDTEAMKESAAILREGIERARIGDSDRLKAIKRLRRFVPEDSQY